MAVHAQWLAGSFWGACILVCGKQERRAQCRRPVTLSRQWTAATRLGGDGVPVATGRPRPVAELRAILDKHLLSGAHPAVCGADDADGGDSQGAGVAVEDVGAGAEVDEAEEERRRHALGLPWLPEYEAQLVVHAQRLSDAATAGTVRDGASLQGGV